MNGLLGCQGVRFPWHEARLRPDRCALALGCGRKCLCRPVTPTPPPRMHRGPLRLVVNMLP